MEEGYGPILIQTGFNRRFGVWRGPAAKGSRFASIRMFAKRVGAGISVPAFDPAARGPGLASVRGCEGSRFGGLLSSGWPGGGRCRARLASRSRTGRYRGVRSPAKGPAARQRSSLRESAAKDRGRGACFASEGPAADGSEPGFGSRLRTGPGEELASRRRSGGARIGVRFGSRAAKRVRRDCKVRLRSGCILAERRIGACSGPADREGDRSRKACLSERAPGGEDRALAFGSNRPRATTEAPASVGTRGRRDGRFGAGRTALFEAVRRRKPAARLRKRDRA